jgi:hypothetical protein
MSDLGCRYDGAIARHCEHSVDAVRPPGSNDVIDVREVDVDTRICDRKAQGVVISVHGHDAMPGAPRMADRR